MPSNIILPQNIHSIYGSIYWFKNIYIIVWIDYLRYRCILAPFLSNKFSLKILNTWNLAVNLAYWAKQLNLSLSNISWWVTDSFYRKRIIFDYVRLLYIEIASIYFMTNNYLKVLTWSFKLSTYFFNIHANCVVLSNRVWLHLVGFI